MRIDEATALMLLRSGRPRRGGAVLRLLARRSKRVPLHRQLFHEAIALFWTASFEKARARAARANAWSQGELGALPIALQIECLLFEDRVAEAKTLFAAHAAALASLPAYEHVVSSGPALEAMLRFHEGDIEGSRVELEALAGEVAEEHTPERRLISFYLGAIAHKEGRDRDAAFHLADTVERGGDLFVAKWAADTHAELFPSEAAPSRAIAVERKRRRRRSGLLGDLARGLRILFFRRSAVAGTSFTFERTIALLVVNLLCAGLIRFVDFTPGAWFFEYTAIALGGVIALFTIIAWLSTRGARRSGSALDVAGAFYSALPLLLVLDFAGERALRLWSTAAALFGLMLGAWTLGVVLFIVREVTRGGALRMIATALAVTALAIAPMAIVRKHPLWFDGRARVASQDHDRDERNLHAFLFAQADHVHAAEAALAPERPGVEDLYFVGFAGWGAQDVFLNEVTAAQALFDERFDTRGHSLALANDPSSRRKLPMATKLNLGHVLKAVGERMNPEEDVLFLFLTSHGSEAGLSLESSGHPYMATEGSLSPSELSALLEETRIKWRVIVVAGCETGVFIAPLQNEHTLVATASAHDRKSFGCESGRQFTEYGRAVFAEQLLRERSFETALLNANAAVAEREKERGLTPSLPQLSVGSAIREKLRGLERRVPDAVGGSLDGGPDAEP